MIIWTCLQIQPLPHKIVIRFRSIVYVWVSSVSLQPQCTHISARCGCSFMDNSTKVYKIYEYKQYIQIISLESNFVHRNERKNWIDILIRCRRRCCRRLMCSVCLQFLLYLALMSLLTFASCLYLWFYIQPYFYFIHFGISFGWTIPWVAAKYLETN